VRLALALALALGPKAELGRHLFYDQRLSGNGTQSCASCHRQELAFTDGRPVAIGSTGEAHTRNSMTLVNVRAATTLTWADPAMRLLDRQALVPMFGEHPVELGASRTELPRMLRADAKYRALFGAAFPGVKDPFTIANVAGALAAFERTIVSTRSAYDRYYYGGQQDAISDAAKRGEVVFFTESLGGCFRCHAGRNFTDGQYHDNGVADRKFKTPTLRNVELTGPYMHDGRIATLEAVVEHYVRGGGEVRRRSLTQQNRADLVEFLRALTDREVVRDPKWRNPW